MHYIFEIVTLESKVGLFLEPKVHKSSLCFVLCSHRLCPLMRLLPVDSREDHEQKEPCLALHILHILQILHLHIVTIGASTSIKMIPRPSNQTG